MFAQDSTMNSSSDDEGVMSHFVLSKPRKTPYSALKNQKEKDVWPSEMLLCGGASFCAVIIALLSTVGYTVFVHMHLLHLENLVQKLQTGVEGNSSDPSLSNLKMAAAQMERVKMLNDMTDLSQLQNNLSSVHDQFVMLQRFYKDMEENPNIVQFLSSITEQLTPLSQSVVLMSDGFHDIQKSVEVIEADHHTLLQSVDELNSMTHNLQIANTSHLIEHLEDRVLGLQIDFTQLKNAVLDETATHRLENRIAKLEGQLSSVLANHGNFLNITLQRSSNVNDADTVVKDVDEESDYGP